MYFKICYKKNDDTSWFAQGQSIDDIPTAVLEDAAQLVKANSIMGNKMNDVDIVYTMWSNLKKTDGMEPGQVAYHKDKEVTLKIFFILCCRKYWYT